MCLSMFVVQQRRPNLKRRIGEERNRELGRDMSSRPRPSSVIYQAESNVLVLTILEGSQRE